jgi:hypothetical protein
MARSGCAASIFRAILYSNYQGNYFEEQGISWQEQGINRPNLAGRLSAIVESQLRFSHVQLVQTDTQ